MLRLRRIRILGLAIGLCALALPAQSSRTWVSVLGNDANPGTREAPCRTFAGALAKTNAGGEIDALDAGEFGPVVITKAITIDGGGYQTCILQNGDDCVKIRAGLDDDVVLRNTSLDAQNLHNGIVFLSGKSLFIDHCRVVNGTTGIQLNNWAHTPASITITSTHVFKCHYGVAGYLESGSQISLYKVRIMGSSIGLNAHGTCRYVVENCIITHDTYGLYFDHMVLLENCVFTQCSIGIKSYGGAYLQTSNCTLTGNTYAFDLDPTTTYISAGNNRVHGLSVSY